MSSSGCCLAVEDSARVGVPKMRRRPYEELAVIVESLGGEMVFERKGQPHGGAWFVRIPGHATHVFYSNGRGFPDLDTLYLPKTPNPDHYRDYTNTLRPDAEQRWIDRLRSTPGTPVEFPTPQLAAERTRPAGPRTQPVESKAPAVLPPIPNAEGYLARLKSSRGLPERNMEDLVKELFVAIGYSPGSVIFQVGRIDVLVQDASGAPRFVVEVKASLRSKADRDQALRQAFDYAGRNGAPMVVITDADHYEIYDRRAGLDHASMLQAVFKLTAFTADDLVKLDLLRPAKAAV